MESRIDGVFSQVLLFACKRAGVPHRWHLLGFIIACMTILLMHLLKKKAVLLCSGNKYLPAFSSCWTLEHFKYFRWQHGKYELEHTGGFSKWDFVWFASLCVSVPLTLIGRMDGWIDGRMDNFFQKSHLSSP